MSTGLVRRGIRLAIARLNDVLGQKIGLDLFAADVRKHAPIDLNTRAEHLAAFFDHLLTLRGIIDDVAIFIRKIIFA